MKQIIPFNKEITFKTMISKITSISLEHNLDLVSSDIIKGDFIVSGTYKMTDASQIDEEFSYKIPIEINIDEKYDTSNIIIEIDDFVYEVIDEEKVLLKIDLCLDNLELVKDDQESDLILSDDFNEAIPQVDDHELVNERCIDENEIEDAFLDISEQEKLEIPNNNINNDEGSNNSEEKTYTNTYNEVVELNNNDNQDDEKVTANATSVASIFSAFKDTEETFATYCIYIMRENDDLDTVLTKYNTTRDILKEYNDLSDIKVGSKIIIPNSHE